MMTFSEGPLRPPCSCSAETATLNYKKALEKGILKILSKMGISLLSCYHGAQVRRLLLTCCGPKPGKPPRSGSLARWLAPPVPAAGPPQASLPLELRFLRRRPPCPQIFEVYGLGKEVIDTAFTGTVSRIGGMSLADIQRETEAFWAKGFPDKVGPARVPAPWPAAPLRGSQSCRLTLGPQLPSRHGQPMDGVRRVEMPCVTCAAAPPRRPAQAMTKLDDYGFIQSRPKGEYHANNQVGPPARPRPAGGAPCLQWHLSRPHSLAKPPCLPLTLPLPCTLI